VHRLWVRPGNRKEPDGAKDLRTDRSDPGDRHGHGHLGGGCPRERRRRRRRQGVDAGLQLRGGERVAYDHLLRRELTRVKDSPGVALAAVGSQAAPGFGFDVSVQSTYEYDANGHLTEKDL
jgi:hypothetical protein